MQKLALHLRHPPVLRVNRRAEVAAGAHRIRISGSGPGGSVPVSRGVGAFLINVIFDPSFPVEMLGEAGSCTGTERLQVHGCVKGGIRVIAEDSRS